MTQVITSSVRIASSVVTLSTTVSGSRSVDVLEASVTGYEIVTASCELEEALSSISSAVAAVEDWSGSLIFEAKN